MLTEFVNEYNPFQQHPELFNITGHESANPHKAKVVGMAIIHQEGYGTVDENHNLSMQSKPPVMGKRSLHQNP